MLSIKTILNNKIYDLAGHKVHFTSDCDFFPMFDIRCKVIHIEYVHSEYILTCIILKNGKRIKVGSNMKNLKYEII